MHINAENMFESLRSAFPGAEVRIISAVEVNVRVFQSRSNVPYLSAQLNSGGVWVVNVRHGMIVVPLSEVYEISILDGELSRIRGLMVEDARQLLHACGLNA